MRAGIGHGLTIEDLGMGVNDFGEPRYLGPSPPTGHRIHHYDFKPGELCPASRVHLGRGDAWLEMSFNALTGNVENEAAYFP